MNTQILRIKKCALKNLIEPFIYEKLDGKEYEVNVKPAIELLTWNRFDLAFKLSYLDNINVYPSIAIEIYKNDIKAQTLGKFIELGNEGNKKNIEHYLQHFKSTYENIKNNGFLKEQTLIPLSTDGGIINGAHRVACAIHLNENVSTVITEKKTMVADYQYFFNRDVPVKYLDIAIQKFIEYASENVYIAFLWPSGNGFKVEAESKFSKVVYKKKIKLSPQGGFNLLFELYKHMDWVGDDKNGFRGVKQKLLECFPRFEEFQIIVFQSESLEKVQEIKKNVRDIYNIGYSSIHITDTKEEAIRISQFLFNDNGLHFLNNSKLYKNIDSQLTEFKKFLNKNNVNSNDVVIDGSLTLYLYGLRKNADIDYLMLDSYNIEHSSIDFDSHDSELKYHEKTKNELIYDNDNFFIFNGLKFVSFKQLYQMKKSRNEVKDINDCSIMKALLIGSSYQKYLAQMKQKKFYLKIKLKQQLSVKGKIILTKVGLFDFVKLIYKKMKGTK